MSATAETLIRNLTARGVRLSRNADRLRIEAPAGTVTPELKQVLAERKQDLLAALDQRERLHALAAAAGIEAALVDGLSAEQLSFCESLDDAGAGSYLCVVRDDQLRQQGRVPPDETAVAVCVHCGPVWVWPHVVAVSPHIGGFARVAGCAWCTNRARGLPIPRPPVSCGACEHFERDSVNPPAGIGRCRIGMDKGPAPYPFAERTCASWRPSTEAEASA